MTIKEIEQTIIDEFACFDEWLDKYAYIIDLGKQCPVIDEKDKTESNLIKGCQSRVWLHASYKPAEHTVVRSGTKAEAAGSPAGAGQGRLVFTAESDALIVKGIVALLIRVLSGHTPQEILDANLYFIDRIGLRDHLSPTRSNGLLAVVKQMRAYALAYSGEAS
jgi:cysteine desulfuration protein SufE